VRDAGVAELVTRIAEFLDATGRARRARRRRERAEVRFLDLLRDRVEERVRAQVLPGEAYETLVGDIAEGRLDPYSAVRGVLDRLEAR
jgi:putative protein kinase ArgK-like GTPase of G3E family